MPDRSGPLKPSGSFQDDVGASFWAPPSDLIKELGGLPKSKVEVRDAFAKRHGGSDRTPDKAFTRAVQRLGLVEAGDQLFAKGSDAI